MVAVSLQRIVCLVHSVHKTMVSALVLGDADHLRKIFFVNTIPNDPTSVILVPSQRLSGQMLTKGLSQMVVTISANGVVGFHDWLAGVQSQGRPFTFDLDPTILSPRHYLRVTNLQLHRTMTPSLTARTRDGRFILVAGLVFG